MWEDVLKGKTRMHEYNKVYDSLIDGKKRSVFEIATINDLPHSKAYYIMEKMISSKARYFPNVKKEPRDSVRAKQKYVYWREVSK